MSGVFHEGKWYENTDMICRRCKKPVYDADNPRYVYQCFHCDEDFYAFEAEEQDATYLPKVMIARPLDGITINAQIEYVLDDNDCARVFENQVLAELFLLEGGYSPDDIEYFYYVEVPED